MRKRTFALLAACLCLIASLATAGSIETSSPEEVGMSSERLQRLTEWFQQHIDSGRTAGMQILVARRGKVVLHENLGSLDITTAEPVTDDSLFRIYSMTKPIVATAMMILYEEGKFSLQDPLAKFIPEFANLKVYAGVNDAGEMILEDPGRPPNVHDLFLHTAGFTYGIFGDTPVDKLYRDADLLNPELPLKDMIDKLANIPLLHQPGERYVYGVAADIEGYLIEVITGMSANDFVRTRILEPLRMDETMTWVPAEKAARLAKVHVHDDDATLAIFSTDAEVNPTDYAYMEPARFSGGGQLISTADDYFRFAQMLLNGGELDGSRILSPLTVRMMTSNRVSDSIADRGADPGFGYGFHLTVTTDRTQVSYTASNGEFGHGGLATTVFWVDPEQELVVVVLGQYFPTGNDELRDVAHRLVQAAIIDVD